MASDLMHFRVLPTPAQNIGKMRSGKYCVEFSRYGQDFIPNKVEANSRRPRAIKEECGGCLNRVFPQLVPRIPLREDAFREAFGAITAVGFLNNLKH